MFKTVWSQGRYQEEYKRFCKSLGEPRHTSMIGSMSWHTKMRKQFHKKLRDDGIRWGNDLNDGRANFMYTQIKYFATFILFMNDSLY